MTPEDTMELVDRSSALCKKVVELIGINKKLTANVILRGIQEHVDELLRFVNALKDDK